MIQPVRVLGMALALALAAGCATASGGEQTIDLLAEGLDGFTSRTAANWTYANGILEASDGGAPSILVSNRDFGDFDLTLDVYVSEEHNSGVFVRCGDRARITATSCYEVNIFDKRADQDGRTGGAPGYFAPLAKVDAGGQWNTIRIRAEGRHLLVVFNGITTINADGPLLAAGPIGLQWAAGQVRFRNVRLKRL